MSDGTESAAMAAVFAARTRDELAAGYRDWAGTYDSENAGAGYRLPYMCCAFVARHVGPGDGPVLDAGCGTGINGDALAVLGYRDIVGIDLSEPMLALAGERGAYSSLRHMILGEPLDLPSDHFAAVISSGVFTEGHAPHASFDELIRVTRPGGVLVFSVRDDIYEERGFRVRQEELERDGRWRLGGRSERFRSFSLKEAHVIGRVFVYGAL